MLSRCPRWRTQKATLSPVLGEQPETTVHAAHDIVSGKLSSTTALAPSNPKGQVSRLEATPSKSCPAR
eukprot:scaffold101035_cov57-Phaeocystis_antarctica.AAC.3